MKVIGHRGARFEAPENTLIGFAYANRLGLDAIEFDVRLTSDDQLVVIHDATVDRTTNGMGAVADLTLEELRGLEAWAQFSQEFALARIPTLSDALRIIDDQLHLMIEIKRDSPDREERIVRGILEELWRHPHTGGFTLTSFDPIALEIAASVDPDQRRSYIGAWDSPEFLETALRLGCAQADMRRVSASAGMVADAQAHGMVVTGWPCNSAEDLALLTEWGVDQVCTDSPTMIRKLIHQPPPVLRGAS